MNHTEIERLYLINGLSRSGNHLFITWLLSSFVDGSKWTNGKTETIVEKMEEIYFLNNIYPRSDFDLRNESKVNVENLLKLRAATKDGDDQSEALEDSMKKYLATQSQMRDFLEGKKKKIKVLIISIENNFSYILDMFANRFRKAKNVYKILILRDVLNLFASRFEAEQKVVKEIQKKDPSFKWHKYETDLLTFGYYVNNLFDSFNKKYITFNYNRFILEREYKINLGKKLGIDYEKARVTQAKFLMGSSFKNEKNENMYKYFMRWIQYKDNRLIKIFMEDTDLMKMMCEQFYFCLEDDGKILKIKDQKINVDDYEKEKKGVRELKKRNVKIKNTKSKKLKNKK